jgi:hypothetical protein
MINAEGLITARFRALIALALTGWIAAVHVHPVTWGRPHPWTWMYAGILPTWAVVTINVAFQGCWLWLGVVLAMSSLRKEEKAIWLAFIASGVLIPAGVLLPGIKSLVQPVKTGLILTAFLAAVALFVSLWDKRERN